MTKNPAPNKQNFSILAKVAPVGIFRTDAQGNCIYVNERWCKLAGMSSSEALGEGWGRALHPEDRERVFTEWYQAAENRTAFHSEVRFQRPDGVVSWLLSSAEAELDAEGQVLGYVGTVTDISEIKAAELARLQTEDKLARSKAEFESMFNAIPDGVLFADTERRIIMSNPAAQKMFGYSDAELTSNTTEMLYLNKRDFIDQGKRRFSTEREPEQDPYEVQYKRKDGSTFWTETIGTQVKDVNGNIIGFIGLFRDISERKKTEEALQESQKMLQLVLNSIPVRVFWKDRECVYLGCNQHFARDAGLEFPEQIIGKNDFELSWREHAELYRADDQQVMQDDVSKLNYEEPQTSPDGTPLWLRTSKLPLKDLDGNIFGIMGVYEDITERKRAEKGIHESEQRLAEAQRMAHIGNWELDLVTDELLWSEEVYRIFEIDPRKVRITHENFFDAIHPDDLEQLNAAFAESVKNKIPYNIEHRLRMANGSVKYVQEHCETFYDAQGQPLRSVGTVQDITERVTMEDALRRSQKMEAIGQLSGGIAHDFNNQLAVIIGYLDFLKNYTTNDEKPRLWVDAASKATLRCIDLTRQLLTFTRRQGKNKKVTNLNTTIKGLETMIARSVTPRIEVQYTLADDLSQVKIDPGEFQDTILNLVINARDAMPGGGKLLIETSNTHLEKGYVSLNHEIEAGDYVQMKLIDTGTGMSAETLEHIFEPFFTTKPEGKGTGLGLPMIYGFVKRYGGHIKVDSQPGKGTCIYIYLPCTTASESAAIAENIQTTALPTGSESILIVDDEIALLKLTSHQLTGLGYRTLLAEDPAQAMKILATDKEIDLLFSDVIMPGGMNGYELAQQAVEIRPGLKVLLTSGVTAKAISINGMARFSAHLLNKPYRRDDLARRIRLVLDEKTGR